MPVEIRELIIKATITPEGAAQHTSNGSTSEETKSSELVQLCVEKVLEILKEKNER